MEASHFAFEAAVSLFAPMFFGAVKAFREGLITRSDCQETFQVKNSGKRLVPQLTVVCLKFVPGDDFLDGSCKIGRVSRPKPAPGSFQRF